MDKWKSAPETEATAPHAPRVVTEGTSVVSTREIHDARAKSLNFKIETEADPENKPGNAVGLAPNVDYFASGGSVICADSMSGIVADTIDFSVCTKKTKVRAEQVDESPQPSDQDPAVRFIINHKVGLISQLRADPSLILQHVYSQNIITEREYSKIKSITDPEKAVIEIIDHVISKGQEICSRFLELLKNSEVLETFPKLKGITDLMQ